MFRHLESLEKCWSNTVLVGKLVFIYTITCDISAATIFVVSLHKKFGSWTATIFGVIFLLILKPFFLFDCDEPDNNTRITRITGERLTFSCRRFLFDLTLYVPSTIFQLNRDGSTWVEPVLSLDKCVLLKDHNAVTPVRLEPATPRSRVKHSTTEPLRSLL